MLSALRLDSFSRSLVARSHDLLAERVARFALTQPLLCGQLDVAEVILPDLIELRQLHTVAGQVVMELVIDVLLVTGWKMDLARVRLVIPQGLKVILHPNSGILSGCAETKGVAQAAMLPRSGSCPEVLFAVGPRARSDAKESGETRLAHVHALYSKAVKGVAFAIPRRKQKCEQLVVAVILAKRGVTQMLSVQVVVGSPHETARHQ